MTESTAMKHTPGPWTVEWPTSAHVFVINGKSATDGEDMAIAEVWSGEEDARLIAAAPDLLEIVKMLHGVLEHEPNTYRDHLYKTSAGRALVLEVLTAADGRQR